MREDNPDREDRSTRPKQRQDRAEREPEKGRDSKLRKERTRREQEDYNRKEQENSGPRERGDHGRERPGTWMGVGQHSWEKVLDSKQPFLKTAGKGGSSRLWVFGDSLMREVGQAIHSLSKDMYEIVDRSVSGASIRDIRKTVEDNLSHRLHHT